MSVKHCKSPGNGWKCSQCGKVIKFGDECTKTHYGKGNNIFTHDKCPN